MLPTTNTNSTNLNSNHLLDQNIASTTNLRVNTVADNINQTTDITSRDITVSEILNSEIFIPNMLALANAEIQKIQYQQTLTTNRVKATLTALILFLQLNNKAKPQYRSMFKIEYFNTGCKFIFKNLCITLTDDILDTKQFKNLNSLAAYILEIPMEDDYHFKMIIVLNIIKKYIADGIAKPESKNDSFETIISQGFLPIYFATKLTETTTEKEKLEKIIFSFFLGKDKLNREILEDISKYPLPLQQKIPSFLQLDKNTLVYIYLINRNKLKFIIFSEAKITAEAMLKIMGFMKPDYTEKIKYQSYSNILLLLNKIDTSIFNKIQSQLLEFMFIDKNTINKNILNAIKYKSSGAQQGTVFLILLTQLKKFQLQKLIPYSSKILNFFLHTEDNIKNNLIEKYYNIKKKHIKVNPNALFIKNFNFERISLNLIYLLLINNNDKSFSFTAAHSFAIARLIFMAMQTKDPAIQAQAQLIYHKYIESAIIQKIIKNPDTQPLFGDLEGNLALESPNAYNYFFITPNLVFLLTEELIQAFSNPEASNPDIWKKTLIFTKDGTNLSIERCQLTKIYCENLVIFKQNFLASNVYNSTFIKSLGLGQYEDKFLQALLQGISLIKLYDQNNTVAKIAVEAELGTILTNYIEDDKICIDDSNTSENTDCHSITAEHLALIKNIFQLNNATNSEVAIYLVCLAYMFTKYSSASIFGSEYDSPFALRVYAQGLLQQAYKLLNNGTSVVQDTVLTAETYLTWSKILLGKIPNSYNCTNVLSVTMLTYIKQDYPDSISKNVIPVAWL